MEVSAGKFIDYTGVLWLDVILNAVFLCNTVGLSFWIAWGIKERRQGVEGAVRKALKKAGHASGWKPRTRWTMAGVAVGANVALMVLGAVLMATSKQGGGIALGWGITYTVLWLVAGPLLRPVAGKRPEHSREWDEPHEGDRPRTA
ncbi:hypothetical protein [Streptomyces flavofungini]|uniref:hypothetical protein n=1 Tax=Streptomyces flavofungini TaxID=68200 RepID=UPI0034DFDE61